MSVYLYLRLLFWVLLGLSASPLFAEPPKSEVFRKVYEHDKTWLANMHPAFVAANMRGDGLQYAERRQAAIDLVREKRLLAAIPELMEELKRDSFLSAEICDLLAEWKVNRAKPLLSQVQNDKKRSPAVREHAKIALARLEGKDPAPIDPAR